VSQKNVDIGFRAVFVRESFGQFRRPRTAIGQPVAEPHDGGGQRRRILGRKTSPSAFPVAMLAPAKVPAEAMTGRPAATDWVYMPDPRRPKRTGS